MRLGRVFFGESMFRKADNASKVGFVTLVEWLVTQGVELIDCQAPTAYLASFGAKPVPRDWFLDKLASLVALEPRGPWELRPGSAKLGA